MKDILKPIIVLALICLLVTASLAYVNIKTAPVIKAAEEKAASSARHEVLKEAETFERINSLKLPDGAVEAYKGNDESGYAIIVKVKGYGGDMKLMCGIRHDGTMEGVKTLTHNETTGIGSRVVDNNSKYKESFAGTTAGEYRNIDTVSGATISSKAYKKGIGIAFDAFKAIREAEHENAE